MPDSKNPDTLEYQPMATLLKHFGPSPIPINVQFGALSHPGKVRANNEDHYLVVQRRRSRTVLLTNLTGDVADEPEDRVYVLAIADGMGGAAHGELASSMALRSAFDLGHSALKWVFKITDQEIRDLKEQLDAILQLVHRELGERSQMDRNMRGMGTTLTGAYIIGFDAFIAHIGDSRAYLYRDGSLARLTRDHTLVQAMMDAGLPGPDPSMRHVLTNCLGGSRPDVKVDFNHVQLQDGDRLLFCTDGLTEMASEERIAETLGANSDPQAACAALVDLALANGGKDNVTTVVANFARSSVPK